MPKGCHNNHAKGDRSGKWKGGIMLDHDYIRTRNDDHSRSTKGYVLEHILIAEKILGRPLPKGTVIHHTDGNKGRINPYGMVICQDQSYHAIIEARLRALMESGHADWRKCCYCHNYDDTKNMIIRQNGSRACHQECEREYQRRRRAMAA